MMAAIAVIAVSFLVPAGAAEPLPCGVGERFTARIARVVDGRSVALDDGRIVVLAGIRRPADDLAALSFMVGQDRAVRPATPGTDRYGRLPAFVTLPDGQLAQQVLLADGAAQLADRIGDAACVALVRAAETPAREARRGLWAQANFAARSANDAAGLATSDGRFAVVEGRVVSVREVRGMVYVNFGRAASGALTATVRAATAKALAREGLAVASLAGRQVRMRGWVELRSGPRLALDRAEQVEILSDGAAAATGSSAPARPR